MFSLCWGVCGCSENNPAVKEDPKKNPLGAYFENEKKNRGKDRKMYLRSTMDRTHKVIEDQKADLQVKVRDLWIKIANHEYGDFRTVLDFIVDK